MSERLTDAELQELSEEHYLDGQHCRAASEDACAYGDGWPCRIRRLLDEVIATRAQS